MITRTYISAIVGDGSDTNPFRPKVADYQVKWSSVIKSTQGGHPEKDIVIVSVTTEDHSQLMDDPEITLLS